MHLIPVLLFILLFSAFRWFDLGDSLQGFIYWFSTAALLVIGSGLFYWKFRGCRIAVLVSSVMLASCFIALRFTSWSGYTVDVARTESNMPTVQPGDVVISKWFNLSFQPGDMVAVEFADRLDRKRIHGVPGDHVFICDTKVYINGRHYSVTNHWQGKEKEENERCSNRRSSLVLATDEYFVLGDNINDSYDSRYYGPVSASTLVANPVFIIIHREDAKAVPLQSIFTL